MAASFDDFLKTQKGREFAALAAIPVSFPLDSLRDKLSRLVDEATDLSLETLKPTYEPVLEGLVELAGHGAQVMSTYGIAKRTVTATVADSGKHLYHVGDVKSVFNALAAERQYHGMMYDAGRETVQKKSPSELAFTVLGLLKAAQAAQQAGPTSAQALKLLKDAVATSLRAIEESEEPDSFTAQAQAHYQKTHAPGGPSA